LRSWLGLFLYVAIMSLAKISKPCNPNQNQNLEHLLPRDRLHRDHDLLVVENRLNLINF